MGNEAGISEKKQLLLSSALATAVLAVSFAAIFIKLSEAPALAIAFYRLFFTLVLLLPGFLLRQRKELRFINTTDIWKIFISGFFLAAHFYLWIASLSYSPVVVAVVLVSLHPILVAVAGRFLLGDQIPSRFIPALIIVLIGTVAIATESIGLPENLPTELRGILMAFGGAAMMAGYLLVGRHLRQRLSTTVYAGGTYAAASLFLLIIAIFTQVPLLDYPGREFLIFAALAVIPTLLGHTVFNWALKRVRASLVSLLYLGEPLGATILALIILGEVPSPLQITGGAAILTGLYLVIKPASQ
ncbi:MAG: DMT family transporter [Bacillota bacterium]